MAKRLYKQQVNTVRSQIVNIDNGAGTTLDEALFNVGSKGGQIVRVYALYNEAAGTVAGANFKLGSSAGGARSSPAHPARPSRPAQASTARSHGKA